MGFSVRMMKGVSMRVGGFQGGVEKQVSPIDEGRFTLTNKRVIFSGEKKSVSFLLNHLVTIDELENGIVISRKNKTKMEYYIGFDVVSFDLTLTYNEKDDEEYFDETTIEYILNGEEIKKMIQKLFQE